MATPYDDTFKIFISENAQDFLSWLVKGAQLKEKLLTEFEGRKVQADALLSALLPEIGEELLLGVECQSEKDPDMPERLLEYNLRARREHKRPVLSCVIYLRNDGEVQQSPLRWEIPGGQEILRFYYLVIEVARMTPDDFRQLGLPGLLPFMIMTRGGTSRAIAEEIFTGLEQAGKQESLAAAYTLASLAFGKQNSIEQHWLLRRLSNMHESLRDTPVYQEMTRWAREEGHEKGLEEGLEKGLEKGLQQGLQQGRQQGLQEGILDVVIERFPELTRLTQERMVALNKSETLRNLLVKLSVAQNMEEARRYLLEMGSKHDNEPDYS
jgi:predicted transposase YdaD